VRQEILVLGSQALQRKHQEDRHSGRDIDFSSQMGMDAENTKALVSATVVNHRNVSAGRPSGEFGIFASLADLHHRLGVHRLPHGEKNTKQDLPLDTCCAQSMLVLGCRWPGRPCSVQRVGCSSTCSSETFMTRGAQLYRWRHWLRLRV
jgi:hypothetical protein